MPLLLNVLRNANGADYRKLRVKTMEYVALIGVSLFAVLPSHMAIAVGGCSFRLDADTLVELLITTSISQTVMTQSRYLTSSSPPCSILSAATVNSFMRYGKEPQEGELTISETVQSFQKEDRPTRGNTSPLTTTP